VTKFDDGDDGSAKTPISLVPIIAGIAGALSLIGLGLGVYFCRRHKHKKLDHQLGGSD
jgi:disulfide bond formation protein DsbB